MASRGEACGSAVEMDQRPPETSDYGLATEGSDNAGVEKRLHGVAGFTYSESSFTARIRSS
jgi:hypothetical protein